VNADAGALVCGFGDLEAGLGGIAWSFAGGGGLLLSDGQVAEAEAELAPGESGGQELRLRRGDLEVSATLAPRGETLPLKDSEGRDAAGGQLAAAACEATVRSSGGGQTLACAGHLSRWSGDPLEGAGTFRHLAIDSEGSLLIIAAQGPPGAKGHDEEATGAWLLDGAAASAFGESLISTQYDASGSPTRIGLELWPQGEGQTSRAAATRGSGSRIGGGDFGSLSAALLRCHTEGVEGLGSYLVWRA
jgi:hypothetical protein